LPGGSGLLAKRRAGHKNIVYIGNIAAKVHPFEAGEKELEEFQHL
jgi:hypothetical protein